MFNLTFYYISSSLLFFSPNTETCWYMKLKYAIHIVSATNHNKSLLSISWMWSGKNLIIPSFKLKCNYSVHFLLFNPKVLLFHFHLFSACWHIKWKRVWLISSQPLWLRLTPVNRFNHNDSVTLKHINIIYQITFRFLYLMG